MKSVEHRKLIYAFVADLLGRELTEPEHESLKVLLGAMNKDATDVAIETVQRMKDKLKPMGKALWHALHKKGFPDADLAELKTALQLTDEDVVPKPPKKKLLEPPELN